MSPVKQILPVMREATRVLASEGLGDMMGEMLDVYTSAPTTAEAGMAQAEATRWKTQSLQLQAQLRGQSPPAQSR